MENKMEFLKKLFLLLVVAIGCAAPVRAMDGDQMSVGDYALQRSRALAAQFADLLNDSDDDDSDDDDSDDGDDMLSREELLEALEAKEVAEAERLAAEAQAAAEAERLAAEVQAAAEAERLKREAQLARERKNAEKAAAGEAFKATAQGLFQTAKQQTEEAIKMDQMDKARTVLQKARNHISNYRDLFEELPDDLKALRKSIGQLQDRLLDKSNALLADQQAAKAAARAREERLAREAEEEAERERLWKQEEAERLAREEVEAAARRKRLAEEAEEEAARAEQERRWKEQQAREAAARREERIREAERLAKRDEFAWGIGSGSAAEDDAMFGGRRMVPAAGKIDLSSIKLSLGGGGFPDPSKGMVPLTAGSGSAAADEVLATGKETPKELNDLVLQLSLVRAWGEDEKEAALIKKIKAVLQAQPGLELQEFILNSWGDKVTPMYKMSENLSKERVTPLLKVMDLTQEHLEKSASGYRTGYLNFREDLAQMLAEKEAGRIEAVVAAAQAGLADGAPALSGTVLNDGQLDFAEKSQQDFGEVERAKDKHDGKMSFIRGDLGKEKSASDFHWDNASTTFHNQTIYAEQQFVPPYADLNVCGMQAMVSANAIVAEFLGQEPVMGPHLPLAAGASFQEVWANNQPALLPNFAELQASGKLTVSFLDHGQDVESVATPIAQKLQEKWQAYEKLEMYEKSGKKDLPKAAAVVFVKGRKELVPSYGMGPKTANDPLTEHWFAVILLQKESNRDYRIRTHYIIVDALGFYKPKDFSSGNYIYNQSRLKDSTVKALMEKVESYLATERRYSY